MTPRQAILRVSALRQPLIDHLADRLDLTPEDARASVDHLIRSEQAGKASHGLIRVSYTTTSGKFGPYGGKPAPQPTVTGPAQLQVDGSGHFGYAVMQRIIDAGCREARSQGTCVATGTHVYPSGALGDWARLAAEQGVGLVLMASSPRRVAPTGASAPVVGTNAICIALPTLPLPFVADCATSEIPHGALLLARATGAELPPRSAVDRRGEPTTDASDVDPTKGLGALLPFGGSHKAFAVGMGIELLACLGGGLPGQVEAGKHGVFAFFIGPALLEARRQALSAWLQQVDASGTRIPGWNSGRMARDQQDQDVVTVPRKTLNALVRLGLPSAAHREIFAANGDTILPAAADRFTK